MVPYNEVKRRFGPALASTILQEKKQLEAAKAPGCAITYYMDHPDAKGVEETWLWKG